jgi:uncharacterized membrane protein
MLRFKGLLALSLVLLLVAVAPAQEQREGRRGGGRGGFGGFGGMFSSPAGLVGMPQVQEELNLTDEQKKEVAEGLAQMRSGFGNPGEAQNLSQEEREKRMEEFQKAGKAFEEKLNKILKPEQQARLKQLNLQRQGAMALSQPELAKQLGLTEDQQKKIRGIQESGRPNFQDLSPEERQKLMAEIRERQEKVQGEVLAVLTDEQKAKYAELKGKEFTFPQFGFGGGGRGGNGQRRRPPTKQE